MEKTMMDLEYIKMVNGLGETVIIQENTDGTATGTLEGVSARTWSSFDKAYNALFRAGFRE
jgi:hypothetical protein